MSGLGTSGDFSGDLSDDLSGETSGILSVVVWDGGVVDLEIFS